MQPLLKNLLLLAFKPKGILEMNPSLLHLHVVDSFVHPSFIPFLIEICVSVKLWVTT